MAKKIEFFSQKCFLLVIVVKKKIPFCFKKAIFRPKKLYFFPTLEFADIFYRRASG